jgi:hypothetical protein
VLTAQCLSVSVVGLEFGGDQQIYRLGGVAHDVSVDVACQRRAEGAFGDEVEKYLRVAVDDFGERETVMVFSTRFPAGAAAAAAPRKSARSAAVTT